MIHIAAVTQLRLDTEGRAYYRRKRAEGKKPLEAMRRLKRRISDAIYRQLLADQQHAAGGEPGAGPGGHCGASQEASALDLPPPRTATRRISHCPDPQQRRYAPPTSSEGHQEPPGSHA